MITVINYGVSALHATVAHMVPQNPDAIKKVGFVQSLNLKQLFVTTTITEFSALLHRGIEIKHQDNGRTFGLHNDSV